VRGAGAGTCHHYRVPLGWKSPWKQEEGIIFSRAISLSLEKTRKPEAGLSLTARGSGKIYEGWTTKETEKKKEKEKQKSGRVKKKEGKGRMARKKKSSVPGLRLQTFYHSLLRNVQKTIASKRGARRERDQSGDAEATRETGNKEKTTTCKGDAYPMKKKKHVAKQQKKRKKIRRRREKVWENTVFARGVRWF